MVGGRDEAGLETTVAFVVPRRGHRVDVAALDAHCRERMAAFKRPRQVHVVAELPKTATGKIQRFALRSGLAALRRNDRPGCSWTAARSSTSWLPAAADDGAPPLVFLHEGLGSLALWRTFPATARAPARGAPPWCGRATATVTPPPPTCPGR